MRVFSGTPTTLVASCSACSSAVAAFLDNPVHCSLFTFPAVSLCTRLPVSHQPLTGQLSHRAALAVHTSAPSSMIAWLKAQALPPRRGTSAPAVSQTRRAAVAPRSLGWNARRITRATLVSTAAVARSYAKHATAPAVYLPTPGSRTRASRSSGTTPAVLRHHRLRQPVEVRRPAVIAQPFPALPHHRRGGRRQGLDGRVALQEPVVVRLDPCHLGLLKHELRHHDAVRIPGPPPGQVAAVAPEPAEQAPAELRCLELAVGPRLTRHGG